MNSSLMDIKDVFFIQNHSQNKKCLWISWFNLWKDWLRILAVKTLNGFMYDVGKKGVYKWASFPPSTTHNKHFHTLSQISRNIYSSFQSSIIQVLVQARRKRRLTVQPNFLHFLFGKSFIRISVYSSTMHFRQAQLCSIVLLKIDKNLYEIKHAQTIWIFFLQVRNIKNVVSCMNWNITRMRYTMDKVINGLEYVSRDRLSFQNPATNVPKRSKPNDVDS